MTSHQRANINIIAKRVELETTESDFFADILTDLGLGLSVFQYDGGFGLLYKALTVAEQHLGDDDDVFTANVACRVTEVVGEECSSLFTPFVTRSGQPSRCYSPVTGTLVLTFDLYTHDIFLGFVGIDGEAIDIDVYTLTQRGIDLCRQTLLSMSEELAV